MFKDFTYKYAKVEFVSHVQEDDIMEDVGKRMPRIYACLEN